MVTVIIGILGKICCFGAHRNKRESDFLIIITLTFYLLNTKR